MNHGSSSDRGFKPNEYPNVKTIDASKLVLRKILAALNGGEPPRELSPERFDRTHEQFERSSDQQKRILRWLTGFTLEQYSANDDLKILSVGCGSGILDLPLMRSLSRRRSGFEYTAVDPNPTACERFRAAHAQVHLPNVRFRLIQTPLEGFEHPAPFCSVLAVHSLYYLPDFPGALRQLTSILKSDGHLIVFLAPNGALNQLANCFWGRSTDLCVWYSDRLEAHLIEEGFAYKKQRIDARLDITACFQDGSPLGTDILEFSIQADLRELSGAVKELCLDYLRAAGEFEGGRHFIAHPVDVFVIKPPSTLKSPGPPK